MRQGLFLTCSTLKSVGVMFLTGIAGMNRVLERDVEAPYLTLVTGPPGSMKSSFCMTMISNHLANQGGFGLYCTVEETVSSLQKSTRSLGIRLPRSLQITDFTELRKDNQNMDYLKFTRKMIEHFKQKEGDNFRVFVLDSLGAGLRSRLHVGARASPVARRPRGLRV